MGTGTGDKAHGKLDEAKGTIKEKVGRATGDQSTEAEGSVQKAKGKGKQAWGNVKEAVDDLKK